jgi:hypothetical protein
LIVLDDLASGDAPFAWTPIPDKNPGSRLGDWMGLPWGGPETIILPGFHTAAEHALSARRRSPGAGGSEIFLSVCGMMSCGAQTLLVSRWRTGGQTAYDLVREFAQELPHTTAADAWQRAVLLTADTRLNLAAEPRLKAEPRVKPAPGAEAPRANHPFFWAGYLLIDSGSDQEVESDAAGAAEPALPKLPAAKEGGPPADPAGKEGGPPADPAE